MDMPTPVVDPARLAALPADLRGLFEAQQAMLGAERRRADREHQRAHEEHQRAEHERAARLHVESELAAFKETVERLELLVKEYERARFGKRSEKFNPDQLQLVLEEIEIAIAEVQEQANEQARGAGKSARGPQIKPRRARLSRPLAARRHGGRTREIVDCPCGCGRMAVIGEDRSCRLDVTAAQYRVIETVRPRYACSGGCAGVARPPRPPIWWRTAFRPRRCWRRWRSPSSANTCRSIANRRCSPATGFCLIAPCWRTGWERSLSIWRRSSSA